MAVTAVTVVPVAPVVVEGAEVAAEVAFPENLVLLVVVAAAVAGEAVEEAMAALVLQVLLAVVLRPLITLVSCFFGVFQFSEYQRSFHSALDTDLHELSPNRPFLNRSLES